MENLDLLELLLSIDSSYENTGAFSDFAEKNGITCVEFIKNSMSEEPERQILYSGLKTDENLEKGQVFSSGQSLPDGCLCTISVNAGADSPLSNRELELFTRLLLKIKLNSFLSKRLEYNIFHERQFGFYTLAYGLKVLNQLLHENKISDFAIIFFNICNLGKINDLIGRDNGSVAMKNFVKSIEEKLNEQEVLWRLGGDNFAACIKKDNLENILELLRGFDVKFSDSPKDVIRLSAVTGVFECNSESKNLPLMIDRALICMNFARFSLRSSCAFYNSKTGFMLNHMKEVESDFDAALLNGEFVPYFQPKVSLENNVMIGSEQLCRWIKDGKPVPPVSFIPVLEKSRRICQLDFYMLEYLCKSIRRWLDSDYEPVPVSSNFSRMHLSNINLASQIIQLVDKYQIPHELVVIEVTETTNEKDTISLKNLVFTLKKVGIKCSVDDFGVGYSSMALIRDVPFSDLKIDKSFLDFNSDTKNRNVVMMQHVISMAEDLGMSCIAEGAETDEHIDLLKKIGCLNVQGYYFDKPLPLLDYEKRLKDKKYIKK